MKPHPVTEPRPWRILLVEDEVLIRMVLAEHLRDLGLTVVEAGSAEEARAYLGSGGEVDLIFSDVHMPGAINGLDLAREVRATYPGLKIVLASGNAGPLGAQGQGLLVQKPYELQQASDIILQALGAP